MADYVYRQQKAISAVYRAELARGLDHLGYNAEKTHADGRFEIGAGKTMSAAAARDGADKTPFLRTSNVLWDEIDLSTVMAVPDHGLPAKLLRPGDLLVCEGGEIGRAAVWTGEPRSFQNHLHRLWPIVPDVEPRF